MRLNKAQREALITWIAEGLESDEINKRAAKFKPRFQVSRNTVTHYRKTRAIDLETIQAEAEVDALKTGFAIKENRVRALQKLADKMMADLIGDETTENKMWLLQVKGIGSRENFERVEYWEFNRSEVESLRGLLDDIAAEVGERIRKTDLTSGGKPLPRPMNLNELSKLSDDELAVLENAARILERSGADQETSLPG
jgi:hypothetical protein